MLEDFIGRGGTICRKGQVWKAGAIQYFVLYQLIFSPNDISLEPRPRKGNVVCVVGFFGFALLLSRECHLARVNL